MNYSHTVGLTIDPKYKDLPKTQELAAEIAHTQLQPKRENLTLGKAIDNFQKGEGLKLLRKIDFSQGAIKSNIQLAEKIKSGFKEAIGDKALQVNSVLDRAQKYYTAPQHNKAQATNKRTAANSNQASKSKRIKTGEL